MSSYDVASNIHQALGEGEGSRGAEGAEGTRVFIYAVRKHAQNSHGCDEARTR